MQKSETDAKAIIDELNDKPWLLDEYAKAAREKPIDFFDFMKNVPKVPGMDATAIKGAWTALGSDPVVLRSADILKRLAAPPQDGWLHVIVHTSDNSAAPFSVFKDNTWTDMTAEELITRLKTEGLQGIQFFSCGCTPLKEVAEQLGATYKIKIANEPIAILETGEAVAAKEGRWKTWDPQKGEKGEWQVAYDDNTTPVPEGDKIRAATPQDSEQEYLGVIGISTTGDKVVAVPVLSQIKAIKVTWSAARTEKTWAEFLKQTKKFKNVAIDGAKNTTIGKALTTDNFATKTTQLFPYVEIVNKYPRPGDLHLLC